MIGLYIAVVFAWQVIGGIGFLAISAYLDTDGWELVNPYWCHYHHISLNWLGAIVVSLFYTILCPIGAIAYWFYKICTVGRRKIR